MRVYGGTIEEKTEPQTRPAFNLLRVTGSVTIETRRGRVFTLHRAPGPNYGPARFFMEYPDANHPVISTRDNDVYMEAFGVFTVLGNTLTAGTIATIRADTGETETHLIKSFQVHPPSKSKRAWRKDNKTGREDATGFIRSPKVRQTA